MEIWRENFENLLAEEIILESLQWRIKKSGATFSNLSIHI